METFIGFIKKPFIKRIFVLVIIGLILYSVRSLITLLLLTFIFIYLINTAQKLLYKLLNRFIKMERKAIIIALYLIISSLLFLFIYSYVPAIIEQITDIIKSVTNFIANYDTIAKSDNTVLNFIYEYFKKLDLQSYIQNSGTFLIGVISSIGNVSINIVMALILSLFYLLEKERIHRFFRGFTSSKISWIYEELVFFGEKFGNSFGKVIQTQIVIALVNSILSIVILMFLGFPNIVGLFIMIFVLGMIPVAGVFISLIPLTIIAYSIGGIRYIIYVILLVVVLHALEGYVLNPKLMSHNTKLPIFVTFLILIISEHLMGIWGLIVGIPITMFLLEILDVKIES
jgi:Predicted permease